MDRATYQALDRASWRHCGVIDVDAAAARGVGPSTLRSLARRGHVARVSARVYRFPDVKLTGLAELAALTLWPGRRVPALIVGETAVYLWLAARPLCGSYEHGLRDVPIELVFAPGVPYRPLGFGAIRCARPATGAPPPISGPEAPALGLRRVSGGRAGYRCSASSRCCWGGFLRRAAILKP